MVNRPNLYSPAWVVSAVPAIRYRTGDVVRAYRQHDLPCRFVFLDGGVLGRADDMMVVRGVNVFPSSVEAIVRED